MGLNKNGFHYYHIPGKVCQNQSGDVIITDVSDDPPGDMTERGEDAGVDGVPVAFPRHQNNVLETFGGVGLQVARLETYDPFEQINLVG